MKGAFPRERVALRRAIVADLACGQYMPAPLVLEWLQEWRPDLLGGLQRPAKTVWQEVALAWAAQEALVGPPSEEAKGQYIARQLALYRAALERYRAGRNELGRVKALEVARLASQDIARAQGLAVLVDGKGLDGLGDTGHSLTLILGQGSNGDGQALARPTDIRRLATEELEFAARGIVEGSARALPAPDRS